MPHKEKMFHFLSLTIGYTGVTLLYDFMTALLYMVLSAAMASIVARLLNIY